MGRDLIREHISYLRVEKGLAKNSLEAYERDLRKLAAWATKNGLDLMAVSRNDLREWLIDLTRTNISENSKRRLISAVRGFYKALMIDGHIEKNPAEDLATPRRGVYLPRFLNRTEIESLLEAPDTSTENGLRDRAVLEVMYACGLRVSEVCSLKIGDVDTDAAILTTTGKGGKTRRVPIGSSAIEWVGAYLARRRQMEGPPVNELFVTSHRRPLTRQAIHSMIRGYAEKCGLEGVSPHTLRHSFATHLVQNRADIRSVQQMLGHADISTTQIYTHITDAHLRKAYDDFHPRSRPK